jgi:hypothetical protein
MIRATTLPNARVGNITNWDEWDVIALIIINNCLNDSVVSHVRSKNTLQEAWQGLKRLFESQDAIPKMFIKKK